MSSVLVRRWAEGLVGSVLAGRYRLEGVLGAGGMGAVFEAVHLRVQRRVAVKLLLPEHSGDSVFVERFQREARAAARVGGRGTVEVIDFDKDPDLGAFLVMEFLEGETLGERLQRLGRLPWEQVVRLGLVLLRTLSKVHAAGIVHRDLKPDNVFLAREEDGDERAVIVDFGIARIGGTAETSRLTQTGAVVGTPLYMAPEQARGGGAIDHRADLYSLGAILYEALSGSPPFDAETWPELFLKIFSQPPEPLQQRVPGLPQVVASSVEAALAKDPAERPPSAEAMAVMLAEVLPPPERPPWISGAGSSDGFDATVGLARGSVPEPATDPGTSEGAPGGTTAVDDPGGPSTGPLPRPDAPAVQGGATVPDAPAGGGRAGLLGLVLVGLVGALAALATVAVVGLGGDGFAALGGGRGSFGSAARVDGAVTAEDASAGGPSDDGGVGASPRDAAPAEAGQRGEAGAAAPDGATAKPTGRTGPPGKPGRRRPGPRRPRGPTTPRVPPAVDPPVTGHGAGRPPQNPPTAPPVVPGPPIDQPSDDDEGAALAVLQERLRRADAARKAGRRSEARRLYRQIMDMAWQRGVTPGSAMARVAALAGERLLRMMARVGQPPGRLASLTEWQAAMARYDGRQRQLGKLLQRIAYLQVPEVFVCAMVVMAQFNEAVAGWLGALPPPIENDGRPFSPQVAAQFRETARLKAGGYMTSAREQYAAAVKMARSSAPGSRCAAAATVGVQRLGEP